MSTLAERQQAYEGSYDNKMIPTLPIVVKANIRNYEKLIRKLKKPFCKELSGIIHETMHHTAMELDGCVFSYNFAGEFVFILRNDLEFDVSPFCGNEVQKISSIVSSIITSTFMKYYLASEDPPDIIGEAIFEVHCYPLPSLVETMNYLLYKQQCCMYYAVSIASRSELLKLYDNLAVDNLLSKHGVASQKEILERETNIVFDDYYPSFFRRGAACYKAPKIISSKSGDITRKKWIIDKNMPDFLDNRDFVMNILQTGQDILRPERDLIED